MAQGYINVPSSRQIHFTLINILFLKYFYDMALIFVRGAHIGIVLGISFTPRTLQVYKNLKPSLQSQHQEVINIVARIPGDSRGEKNVHSLAPKIIPKGHHKGSNKIYCAHICGFVPKCMRRPFPKSLSAE
jgi:hypothetical protein